MAHEDELNWRAMILCGPFTLGVQPARRLDSLSAVVHASPTKWKETQTSSAKKGLGIENFEINKGTDNFETEIEGSNQQYARICSWSASVVADMPRSKIPTCWVIQT
jgi:hypothetical protein